jgi:hypothetical protein
LYLHIEAQLVLIAVDLCIAWNMRAFSEAYPQSVSIACQATAQSLSSSNATNPPNPDHSACTGLCSGGADQPESPCMNVWSVCALAAKNLTITAQDISDLNRLQLDVLCEDTASLHSKSTTTSLRGVSQACIQEPGYKPLKLPV